MGEAAYSHGGWKVERPLQVIGAQMNVDEVLIALRVSLAPNTC
jgi:hypothetical protein